MADAIVSFPPGSAAGPSGLRPTHLKECLKKVGVGSSLLMTLGRLAAAAIEGKLHHAMAPCFCGANLIPLQKKDGGSDP